MSSGGDDVRLTWRTCHGGAWCRFETAVLPDGNASGLLVVWSGSPEEVLFVGQGGIAKNLRWARQFAPLATADDCYVTWATVSEELQDGIRAGLCSRLRPRWCDALPGARPITVNLPWDAT